MKFKPGDIIHCKLTSVDFIARVTGYVHHLTTNPGKSTNVNSRGAIGYSTQILKYTRGHWDRQFGWDRTENCEKHELLTEEEKAKYL